MSSQAAHKQALRELELRRSYEIKKARETMLSFMLYTKPDYEPNWHHIELCRALDGVAEGRIKRLMISMPPRYGKTLHVNEAFPAYLQGRDPNKKIITAGYNRKLANRSNAETQRIIDSPAYRRVFPNTRIAAPGEGAATGRWKRQADYYEVIDHRGTLLSAGVGSSTTGYGLDCFVGHTLIETEIGQIKIEDFLSIARPPRVLAYDALRSKYRYCRVKAVRRKTATALVTVETAGGRLLTCTPEHRIFTENRGFRQAKDLTSSDVLRTSEGVFTKKSGLRALLQKEIGKFNLLSRLRHVLETVGDRNSLRRLLGLQKLNAFRLPEAAEIRGSGALRRQMPGPVEQSAQAQTLQRVSDQLCDDRPKILQRSLQDLGRGCQDDQASPAAVQGLRQMDPPDVQDGAVLRSGVQKPSPKPANVRPWKSLVCGWSKRLSRRLQCPFQKNAAVCAQARRVHLFLLRKAPNGAAGQRPPYRREQKQQSVRQLDHVVRVLPLGEAQAANAHAQGDEGCGQGSQYVYDLEIEDCHNFFANEVLAHNCGIVDDAVKNRLEAESVTYQENTWNWFTSTMYARREGSSAIIVVATRWNERDLSGQALQNWKDNPDGPPWTVITFPAIAENPISIRDPRKEGEALWPGKFPLKELLETRAITGTRDWASIYQQRPAPASGDLVKKEWWRYYDEAPAQFDAIAISADLNITAKKDSDYTVMQVWGRRGGEFYLLDQVRQQMGWVQQKRVLPLLMAKWPGVTAVYIESAANGQALVDEVRSSIPGVIAVRPQGDKASRLSAISAMIEAGNVFLPNPSLMQNRWVADLIDEVAFFPGARHDDMVDALSLGLASMRARTYDFGGVTGISLQRESPFA